MCSVGLFFFVQPLNFVLFEQVLQDHAIQIVEVGPWNLALPYFVHRRPVSEAPAVGELHPVNIQALGLAPAGSIGNYGTAPDTDAIKGYSIATDAFGRSHSLDQATDSIVRVEVFRLRKKLREFYEGEGADHPVEIVVATGHYRPEFVDRIPPTPSRTPPRDSNPLAASSKPEQGIESRDPSWAAGRENADLQDLIPLGQNPPTIRRPLWSQRGFLATVAILAIVAGAATIWRISRHRYAARVDPAHASTTPISAVPIGSEIRIRCGYSRPIFKDEEGNVWSGDRYFSGGFVTELPNQHIARTRIRSCI